MSATVTTSRNDTLVDFILTSLGLAIYTTHTPFRRLANVARIFQSLALESQMPSMQHSATFSRPISLLARELACAQYGNSYQDRRVEGCLDYRLWNLAKVAHERGFFLAQEGKEALHELARHCSEG
ncbi:hypothetical protein M422DRAFT_252031 [Sphaerobolus stellatus SS14]|uniref:Uncharacterized protein n=1 Tax=Sphaerobolus stellatus (strain SS14) TaxID=990650 RepID=A0A0C9UN89_SPHS4|nr:hypothetical protein M422DRAFT_252031 [Sphaerobolus stellatus SS14]